VIVWKQLSGGIFELYEILPGSMLASIAIVIVSKVDKKPEQSVLDTFDEVKKIIHIHS
jgi:sodium/proline symporter